MDVHGGGVYTISAFLGVATVWQKHCFLSSIGQLAMPDFFVKYMFVMLPTKE